MTLHFRFIGSTPFMGPREPSLDGSGSVSSRDLFHPRYQGLTAFEMATLQEKEFPVIDDVPFLYGSLVICRLSA